MMALYLFLLLPLTWTVAEVPAAKHSTSGRPEIVAVQNGPVTLHGMLWRPAEPVNDFETAGIRIY
jgi:hypothetical protein